jgi:hypothetical protein
VLRLSDRPPGARRLPLSEFPKAGALNKERRDLLADEALAIGRELSIFRR